MQKLPILAALVVFCGPAAAQQFKAGGPVPAGQPSVSTTVNLTVGTDKLPFCFWGSAMYSPGSHLTSYDVAKKADACFHCNADGTWDSPCQ